MSPEHVIFLAQCSIACLVSVSHMRKTCMWLKTSHDSRFAHGALCPHKNTCLHTQRNMALSTPSLMIPPSLSTSSLLTCTPMRPSTSPSTGPLQISSSDEIYHCDDPINVSFGSLADLHSPTTTTTTAAAFLFELGKAEAQTQVESFVFDGCTGLCRRRHIQSRPPEGKTPALVVATQAAECQSGSNNRVAPQRATPEPVGTLLFANAHGGTRGGKPPAPSEDCQSHATGHGRKSSRGLAHSSGTSARGGRARHVADVARGGAHGARSPGSLACAHDSRTQRLADGGLEGWFGVSQKPWAATRELTRLGGNAAFCFALSFLCQSVSQYQRVGTHRTRPRI